MPTIGTKVLFFTQARSYQTGFFSVNTRRTADGQLLGAPIQIEMPVIGKAMDWAPIPDPLHPMWHKGTPNPGCSKAMEGQAVLVLCGKHVYVDRATVKPLPFPGFAGGPMTRYEGVSQWLALDAWFSAKGKEIPVDIRDGETVVDAEMRLRREWVDREAPKVVLGIMNDGEVYQRHFSKLIAGQKVRRHRCLVGLDHWIGTAKKELPRTMFYVDRSSLIYDYVYGTVLNWIVANPDSYDAENSRYERDYDLAKRVASDVMHQLAEKRIEALHREILRDCAETTPTLRQKLDAMYTHTGARAPI